MEAKLAERSLSCNKQMRNSKVRAHQVHPFYHHHQQEVAKGMMRGHGGVFLNPTLPYSLSSSLSLPPMMFYHNNIQAQQPPLLPLPISKPIFHSLPPPTNIRKPTNKKPTTTVSVDPTAFVASNRTLAEVDPNKKKHTNKTKSKNLNPKPKLATKTGQASEPVQSGREKQPMAKEVFIYSLSPPPSSLPLPKFSLMRQQPKLSCTVEAAVTGDQIYDDGATNNLRQMLKLR